MTLPEEIGAFTFYGPDSVPGKTGWSMAAWESWLPGVFDSRDACLLIAGMTLADYTATQALIVRLRDEHNRAAPSVDISVGHILAATNGLPDPDDDEDEEEDGE